MHSPTQFTMWFGIAALTCASACGSWREHADQASDDAGRWSLDASSSANDGGLLDSSSPPPATPDGREVGLRPDVADPVGTDATSSPDVGYQGTTPRDTSTKPGEDSGPRDAQIQAALRVLSTVPAEGTLNVRVAHGESAFTIRLSEEVSPATVHAASVIIKDPAGASPRGRFEVMADTIRFIPDGALFLNGNYVITVGTAVSGKSGAKLSAPYELRFRTADATWQNTVTVVRRESLAISAFESAVDDLGNAVVVWLLPTAGDRFELWGAAFNRGSGWGVPQKISKDTLTSASTWNFGVTMRDGAAMAVWTPNPTEAQDGVFASMYSDGRWSAPAAVDAGDGQYVSVVMLSRTSAVAAWMHEGVTKDVVAAVHADGAWQPAARLETEDQVVGYMRLVRGSDGSAYAAWTQSELGRETDRLIVRRFGNGQWSSARSLSTGRRISYFDLAIDRSGKATALCGVFRDGVYLAQTTDSSWTPLEKVFSGDQNSTLFVPVASSGPPDAFAGIGYDSSWGRASRIERSLGTWQVRPLWPDRKTVSYPSVAMDALGRGMAAWASDEGERWHVNISRFLSPSVWTAEPPLTPATKGTSVEVQAAEHGAAFVFWTEPQYASDDVLTYSALHARRYD